MTIDVLIPCARANLISACLKSLAAQERKPDNVIVVTHELDQDSRIGVDIFKKNNSLKITSVVVSVYGAVGAVNAGIKMSKSDILCFIDDDAQARPGWLKQIESYYKKDESVGGVGGRDIVRIKDELVQNYSEHIGQITWYGKVIGNHHCITHKTRQVSHLKGCNMSYRRRLLELVDEKLSLGMQMAEPFWEIEIGFTIRKKGYKIIYDPKILVEHIPATDEYIWNKRQAIAVKNQTYIMLKHFSWPRKLIYLMLTYVIGQRKNLGVAKFIIELFETSDIRGKWREFIICLRYKTKGIKTYMGISDAI